MQFKRNCSQLQYTQQLIQDNVIYFQHKIIRNQQRKPCLPFFQKPNKINHPSFIKRIYYKISRKLQPSSFLYQDDDFNKSQRISQFTLTQALEKLSLKDSFQDKSSTVSSINRMTMTKLERSKQKLKEDKKKKVFDTEKEQSSDEDFYRDHRKKYKAKIFKSFGD